MKRRITQRLLVLSLILMAVTLMIVVFVPSSPIGWAAVGLLVTKVVFYYSLISLIVLTVFYAESRPHSHNPLGPAFEPQLPSP